MLLSLWRTMTLVNTGNAWLSGRVSTAHFNDLLGFEFTKELSITVGFDGELVGRDVSDLFTAMKSSGAMSVRMLASPAISDPRSVKLVAFAGAERWAPVFRGNGKEWIVHCKEDVVDQANPERKIWGVQFGVFAYSNPYQELTPDQGIADELRLALEAAADFATRERMEDWAGYYRGALQVLDQDSPSKETIRLFQYGPEGDERKRLVETVSSGWAFAGMGSWNDVSFSDRSSEEEYDRVSARLWDAFLGALVWAVRP
ncbi:MAG: hypothetical protein JSS66_15665 [Armatimonadetes bacterium]|nr:hypothetical protein [Armatimonadota bacterium]